MFIYKCVGLRYFSISIKILQSPWSTANFDNLNIQALAKGVLASYVILSPLELISHVDRMAVALEEAHTEIADGRRERQMILVS